MDFSAADGKHPVVPPDENKCVWMTAGILSYQLCEREFECEGCPLEAAIHMHFSRPAPGAGQPERQPAEEPAALPGDRSYSPNHCWVRTLGRTPERHRMARVGLEPGLVEALMMPKAVVLPSTGERLKRRRAHLWVVTEGGTFAVTAPTDGVVTATNANLTQRPHTLSSSPLEEGWLFEVDVCENEIKAGELMDPEAARARFFEDQGRFQTCLADALRDDRPRVGATLADGGVPLRRVSEMLGATRYFALLRQTFR